MGFASLNPSYEQSLRNHRQQEIRRLVAARVHRVGARVVVGVIMHVALAANAIPRLYVEADAMALLEDHRGRPDLDLHFDDLSRLEIETSPMRVIRAVRQREFLVEFTM